MKFIPGLKIDYKSGVADLSLPAEFLGQSPEFQAIACSYWMAKIMDARSEAMKRVGALKNSVLNKNTDFKTFEQIIELGHSILLVDKSRHTNKTLCISHNMFRDNETTRRYVVWESFGHCSFIRICEMECRQRSIKTIKRKSRAIFMRWNELQNVIAESTSIRTGDNQPYRHFVADISRYLEGDINEHQD